MGWGEFLRSLNPQVVLVVLIMRKIRGARILDLPSPLSSSGLPVATVHCLNFFIWCACGCSLFSFGVIIALSSGGCCNIISKRPFVG